MKMADGGFRPAYNCQISAVGDGQVVVAVGVDTMGSDRGMVRPPFGGIAPQGRRGDKWGPPPQPHRRRPETLRTASSANDDDH
jgi:hypothetical protein